jgi:hypothetical protein
MIKGQASIPVHEALYRVSGAFEWGNRIRTAPPDPSFFHLKL